MAWVKLHDDILGDPKLMRAARVGGQELVLLPWLLAFASKAADHGRLSVGATAAEPEDIAYQTPGVTAAQVEACQRALVAIGVLIADEDGCLRFAKWEDRQAKPSDSKAAWRERKQRSRSKAKAVTPSRAGRSGTEGHAGDVTPCHATDKKRGEEKRGEAEEITTPVDATASRGSTIVRTDAPPPAPPVAPSVPSRKSAPVEKADNPLPKPLCDAAYEAYLEIVGPVEYSRFRKALLPAYRAKIGRHPTLDELRAGMQAFTEARSAAGSQWFGSYTVEKFAQSLHEFIRLGLMPLMTEWGEPTERGRAAKVVAA